MIKGFAHNAICVLPNEDFMETRSGSYREKLETTVEVLKCYLNNNGITLDCFATDTTFVDTDIEPDRWIATLNGGDNFFVQRNCDGVFTVMEKMLQFPELIQSAVERFPLERGSSDDKRFETILNRSSKAMRDIAKTYKLQVLFTSSKGMIVKYNHRPNTMCIAIDAYTLTASVYMADTKMDTVEILGVPNGNAPVYEWRI